MTFLVLFLLTGATYRLSRLVIADTITAGLREHTVDKIPKTSKWHELLTCFWCISFWLALIVWGAWELTPTATLAISVPLTASTIVGLVARTADY